MLKWPDGTNSCIGHSLLGRSVSVVYVTISQVGMFSIYRLYTEDHRLNG